MSSTKQHIRNSDVVIIVFDIINRKSFDNVRNWVERARETVPENTVFYLCANKNDLQARNKVGIGSIEKLKEELELDGNLETSAHNGSNVKELIKFSISTAIKRK